MIIGLLLEASGETWIYGHDWTKNKVIHYHRTPFSIITTNPYHGRFRMTSLGGCRPRMNHPHLRCSRCPDPKRIRGSRSAPPTPGPSLRDPSRPLAKNHWDWARPAPKSCWFRSCSTFSEELRVCWGGRTGPMKWSGACFLEVLIPRVISRWIVSFWTQKSSYGEMRRLLGVFWRFPKPHSQ